MLACFVVACVVWLLSGLPMATCIYFVFLISLLSPRTLQRLPDFLPMKKFRESFVGLEVGSILVGLQIDTS
jgi:hypothetical protein